MAPLFEPARVKRFVPIFFAVAMGFLAIFFNKQWVDQQKRAIERERSRLAASYQEPIEIVVASRDLAEGARIEGASLALMKVPKSFVQPYAVRDPNDVIGLVALAPIAEREQVLLNKLRKADAVPAGSTLSGLTPKGTRAVTIGVDVITGVGGFVRPGDAVDVLWSLVLPKTEAQPDGQVLMLPLFQDVPVLAVGGDMIGRQADTGERPQDNTVTLALEPQQAAFLLFARDQGRIQLSLRPKGESGPTMALGPTNINTLLEATLGIKPAPPPPMPLPPRQVEVYRGLERDIVVLSSEPGEPASASSAP